MRKLTIIQCRQAVASKSILRAFSTYSSLPDGFQSPEAVADAVAAAVANETEAKIAVKHSKCRALGNATQFSKLERRHLEGEVIATESITFDQLLYPKLNVGWQLIKPQHFEKVPIPRGWTDGLEKLQKRIGIKFQDITLLQSALTHHGCLPNNAVPEDVPVVRLSNRSLEFLGDSLVGAAAAAYLFQVLPRHQEGQLSRAKSALVNNDTLSKISTDLGITDLLLWPPGFREATGAPLVVKGHVTIAAGAGMEVAMNFVNTHILPRAAGWENVQAKVFLMCRRYLPAATKASEFTVELYVKERPILKASAASYKLARSRAAEAAYWHVAKLLGPVP
ncbi:uncharacterized protein CCR75_002746 [Bremia lactucae]|uniref:RNase III domain-containing protein n=1 Tax=Bremia lactucae TaxID=4779 RepID=A0A976FGM0_BRELC|nr:hypothetical protein CCR75_002746 [Bremia lactucae]